MRLTGRGIKRGVRSSRKTCNCSFDKFMT
jgi:hypothetical protein